MKKTFKIFFLVLLFLAVFALFGNVKANSISKILMYIYVDSAGTAHVTETWKCSASEGTEIYHPYYNLGNSQIQNFSVTEGNSTYETLSYWKTSGSLSSKAYKCGINRISNGVELCWGISKYGTHTYIAKYDITNFVSELSDGNQMIYWTLIPYDFSNSIGDVYIKIYTDFNMPQNIDVWGYGNTGYAYVYNGYIEMDSNGRLPSSNYLTILAKFPKGSFNTQNKLNNDFNYYYNMAQEGAQKRKEKPIDFGNIFIYLACISFFISFIGSIASSHITHTKFNLGIKKIELKNIKDYFRDIPCNNIFSAYYLAYTGGLLKNKTDLLGAIILKWIKEGIVTVDKNNKKTSIILSGTDTSKIVNNKELQLFNMLHAASKDGILESNEFKRWCKIHYNKILNWFDIIIAGEQNKLVNNGDIVLEKKKFLFFNTSIYNFQTDLTEKLVHIAGLKKFLLDYTLIEDREAIEVHLFEEYLIYAQMLGIAKQVAKQFNDLYPNVMEESCYSSYDDLILVNTWCASSMTTASSAKFKADNYSSGGGGYSSSGGGGGSFGGGGGGGGFR